ncbi:MAG TPA: PspA/IM30 family protein [Chloroflexota bacterium]|nr:PspA/IM30 family protein [Chloroflexota bacterium]
MGILNRISTITRSNINAILDQAEDPEKMLDQLTRDMRDGINQARVEVAKMIADEKELQANAEHSQQLADDWQRKAELAVSKGAEDLAREALHRKIDYTNNARVYQSQWESQHAAVEKAKSDLHDLQEKYDGAVRNREALLARHRRAKAQQQVAKVTASISAFDPSSDLTRMEERIRLEEARAAASTEMLTDTTEDRFAKLSSNSELEDELAAIKTKVLPPAQIAAPAEPTPPAQ